MKQLLIAFVAIISTATVFGQKNEKKFTYGVRAGVNFSTYFASYKNYFGSDVDEAADLLTRLNAGVFTNISFGEGFSLQPELEYSGMGGKENKVKSTFDYLSLPVLVKYSFGRSRNFGVYTGPYVSYLLSARAKVDSGASTSITSNMHKVDFGNITGLEYQFGGSGLILSVRARIGALNILKGTDGVTYRNFALIGAVSYKL
jgi:hypothetical protein